MVQWVNKFRVPALISTHSDLHSHRGHSRVNSSNSTKNPKILIKAFQLSWTIQILQREVSINIKLESNTYCYLLAQENQHSGHSNSCFLQAEKVEKDVSTEQTIP